MDLSGLTVVNGPVTIAETGADTLLLPSVWDAISISLEANSALCNLGGDDAAIIAAIEATLPAGCQVLSVGICSGERLRRSRIVRLPQA